MPNTKPSVALAPYLRTAQLSLVARGTGARAEDATPWRRQLVSTILGTFREMPGLCVQPAQAARLLGLRPAVCGPVLDDLVRAGLLRRRGDGSYLLP